MKQTARNRSSAREASLARRRAQSTGGKGGTAATAATVAPSRPARPANPSEALRGESDSSVRDAGPSAPSGASSDAGATPERRPRIGQAVISSGANAQATGRALARARRSALSQAGKRQDRSLDRTRGSETRQAPAGAAWPLPTAPADDAGHKACSCGGKGDRRNESEIPPSAAPNPKAGRTLSKTKLGANGKMRQVVSAKPTARLVSQARRAAQSSRGRSASATPSAASLERQANPRVSGRTLARKIRERRSNGGSAGLPKTQPTGRVRPGAPIAGGVRGAQDQPWKVGASETAGGQTVTGTRVGRSPSVTGDEPSTCRTVTGTEYMGAEIFRAFCQAEPARGTAKVRVTSTGRGNAVTGNEVGRSTKVTGDESGTCKNVTGTEYLSAEQHQDYCGAPPEPAPRKVGEACTAGGRPVSGVMVGRSERVTGNEPGSNLRPTGTQYLDAEPVSASARVPQKVGRSGTLSGGAVTGTTVGRSDKVTGDEPGTCRRVTGDQYVGAEQYQSFCNTKAEPEAPKLGVSRTLKNLRVSGTQTGRSSRVTGDEPGTCKAVTGTPYAGLEQADTWCAPEQIREISARTPRIGATPGAPLTGQQPGIGGIMTGSSRGACEPVTGTPFVGADQYAAACGPADPTEGDFPRPLGDSGPHPAAGFSVSSPARESAPDRDAAGRVTGTRYDQGGRITGPFDMGTGKVTGTDQFRFGAKAMSGRSLLEPQPEPEKAPARPRVTGEGQSAGGKITGDDWERGDRVTGTEGTSAARRNPTRHGPMSAMAPVERKRNEEIAEPVSRVTGSSGSTERGALVTYSGGARG